MIFIHFFSFSCYLANSSVPKHMIVSASFCWCGGGFDPPSCLVLHLVLHGALDQLSGSASGEL